MATKPRFQCPACGFAVFNRRVASCESCAAELPIAFRFTSREMSHIDEDHARNEKARVDLARDAAERDRTRQRRNEQGPGTDIVGGILDGLAGDD